MLTPRRDLIQPSKSISTTPYSKIQRADSDPIRQLSLSFNGALTPLTKPSTIFETTGASEVSSLIGSTRARTRKVQSKEEGFTDDVSRITTPVKVTDEGEELNIEGALTDELKILQDKNRHLQQQIEVIFCYCFLNI